MSSITRAGASSTGSLHSVEITHDERGVRVTILGHNGKRHASAILSDTAAADIARFITAAANGGAL